MNVTLVLGSNLLEPQIDSMLDLIIQELFPVWRYDFDTLLLRDDESNDLKEVPFGTCAYRMGIKNE